ncbi:CpsD/CapB family tyrosine-protein kinase [Litoreibacter sp.]|nr:CpsD/CapB family tyrosine-protein kinase [Litoreibacter sp.]
MEQIANPRAMLDTAIRDDRTTASDAHVYATPSDPARAWLRLNEVVIPKSAPVIAQSNAEVKASFDLLRSRILRQMRKDGLRKLALTSPTPSCGTTTLTANLALSLSRQIDLKIIVFDLNLRRPNLVNLFSLTPTAPRSSALSGQRRGFDSTCMRVGHNFGLSLTTGPDPEPAELLGTSRARALIEQIEREFAPDLMLFDLPPVLPHDDVVAASDLYDAALLIARADHSTANQVDRAERLISEQKPCLGVIMNACRFPTQSELGDNKAA